MCQCQKCDVRWHSGMDCALFTALGGNDEGGDDEEATQRFIAHTTKPCPGCKMPTSHYHGWWRAYAQGSGGGVREGERAGRPAG